jgi:hypothetical protein
MGTQLARRQYAGRIASAVAMASILGREPNDLLRQLPSRTGR